MCIVSGLVVCVFVSHFATTGAEAIEKLCTTTAEDGVRRCTGIFWTGPRRRLSRGLCPYTTVSRLTPTDAAADAAVEQLCCCCSMTGYKNERATACQASLACRHSLQSTMHYSCSVTRYTVRGKTVSKYVNFSTDDVLMLLRGTI